MNKLGNAAAGHLAEPGSTQQPKSKQDDISYLLDRFEQLALQSYPGDPGTEFAADMAFADLLIAMVPSLPAEKPTPAYHGNGQRTSP